MARPRNYNTEEELQEAINAYFIYIQGEFTEHEEQDDDGNFVMRKYWTRMPEPATITGLALSLGFESRQSIYDYCNHGEFSYTMKRGKTKVEHGYELELFGKNSTGAIFALKNFGWTDKQEIDHTTKGESLTPTPIIFTKPNE